MKKFTPLQKRSASCEGCAWVLSTPESSSWVLHNSHCYLSFHFPAAQTGPKEIKFHQKRVPSKNGWAMIKTLQ